MASIRLQRTSEYINWVRAFKVRVDGQEVGKIGNGKTAEFVIPPGHHTLSATIDWCSSPDIVFQVEENETMRFKVGGFKHSYWIMPLGILIIVLHTVLLSTKEFQYTLVLLIPIFLYLLYHITIGRNNYLTLYEVTNESANNAGQS